MTTAIEVFRTTAIYVSQLGGWWRMNLDQAAHLIEQVRVGEQVDLDLCADRLRSKPSRRTIDRQTLWIMPCDWSYGDDRWLTAKAELEDLQRRAS